MLRIFMIMHRYITVSLAFMTDLWSLLIISPSFRMNQITQYRLFDDAFLFFKTLHLATYVQTIPIV